MGLSAERRVGLCALFLFGGPEVATMNDGDLIPIGAAAKRLGTSTTTLRRRLRDGEIPTYVRDLDRRRRLARLADVEALGSPRRFDPKEEPMPAA